MHQSKRLSRRREVVLFLQSIGSSAPPCNKLPCDGSIRSVKGKHMGALICKKASSSSSRLLQINEYTGALRLHSRPASSVLPSMGHVSHNNGQKGIAPCVTQIVEDSSTGGIYHSPSVISVSANPLDRPEEEMVNVDVHLLSEDETALHLHQNNVDATLSSLEHAKQEMGASCMPQKNGKNKSAFHQSDEFLLNKESEDLAALLLQHSIPPAFFSSIIKTLPQRRRDKVHFRNIISLLVLLRTMDINIDTIPPVYVRKAPFMYQRDPVIHLQPKIVYLEKLGLHRREMQGLVLKQPYSLYPPIEEIQARILFLRSFPLQHKDVLWILRKAPLIFIMPADKYIKPKLEVFRNVGIPDRFIREMMLHVPRVFSRPLSELQKVIDFLQGLGVGLSSSRVMVFCGSMRVESVQVGVKVLSDVGFSKEDIQVLITVAPGILSKSAQCLTSKLDYLVNVMKRCPREIMKFPVFLGSLSLDKRIRPRHEALVQWAAEKQVNKRFNLPYFLSPSDKVFFTRFPGICRLLTSKSSSQ